MKAFENPIKVLLKQVKISSSELKNLAEGLKYYTMQRYHPLYKKGMIFECAKKLAKDQNKHILKDLVNRTEQKFLRL